MAAGVNPAPFSSTPAARRPQQWAVRTCVIFNPAARGEKAKRFRRLLDAIGAQSTLKLTAAAGDARRLAAEAIGEGFEIVVAAGGDGTLNEVLNGFSEAPDGFEQARLGVLPLGTVNVFARELAIPLKLEAAWAAICRGRETRIDLPTVDYHANGKPRRHYFAQLAGAGLDARAVELVQWQLKKKIGYLAYVVAGLKALMGGAVQNHCRRRRAFRDGRTGAHWQWPVLRRVIQGIPAGRLARRLARRLRLSSGQLAHPRPLRPQLAAARHAARFRHEGVPGGFVHPYLPFFHSAGSRRRTHRPLARDVHNSTIPPARDRAVIDCLEGPISLTRLHRNPKLWVGWRNKAEIRRRVRFGQFRDCQARSRRGTRCRLCPRLPSNSAKPARRKPHGATGCGDHEDPNRPPARPGRRQLRRVLRAGLYPRLRAHLLDLAEAGCAADHGGAGSGTGANHEVLRAAAPGGTPPTGCSTFSCSSFRRWIGEGADRVGRGRLSWWCSFRPGWPGGVTIR